MKLTPEKLAQLKMIKAYQRAGEIHATVEIIDETFRALIADLEEATATRGNGVLVPAPKLEEMQAEILALRKQLAEAQAQMQNVNDCFDAATSEGLFERLAEAGHTAGDGSLADLVQRRLLFAPKTEPHLALQATIAEAVEPYRKDAERLNWLEKVCKETPLNQKAFCSEIAPDTRLRYDFPTLVSYDAIGQKISIRDAIDAAKGEKI